MLNKLPVDMLCAVVFSGSTHLTYYSYSCCHSAFDWLQLQSACCTFP